MLVHRLRDEAIAGARRVRGQYSDDIKFLRSWASRPLTTGAVSPSGRFLARAMAAVVDPAWPGMVVELGRQQAKAPVFQRLTRFVEHYPELLAVGGKRPAAVDMRYPNGFALRFAAASANEGKGKP